MDYIKKINNDAFPEPLGAYSNGLCIQLKEFDLIVLTGQIAINKTGQVQYENCPAKQTEYIFKNIEILLNEVSSKIDDIVKVVIYVTNMDDFKEISEIRNKFLHTAKPVSTLVEVSQLAVKGCLIEIEVTAIKRND